MFNRLQARTFFPRHRPIMMLFGVMALASNLAAAAQEKDEIVTDRPDFVESSDVVGLGRYQIETGVANERNKDSLSRTRVYSTPTLVRVGINNSWELRLETDGRIVARTDSLASGASFTERGYADVALGVKWHVMDGQGAVPAVGLLMHADMDSGSSAFRGKGVRPSVRVVGEWELPGDLSLGVMPGLSLEKTDSGERYTNGILGITLAKSWTERFHTFVELAAPQIAGNKYGGTVATFDFGAAYLVTPLLQLDAAVYSGLNKRTPDVTWAVGLSVKF